MYCLLVRFGESARGCLNACGIVFEASLNSNFVVNGESFKIDRGVCRSLKSNV